MLDSKEACAITNGGLSAGGIAAGGIAVGQVMLGLGWLSASGGVAAELVKVGLVVGVVGDAGPDVDVGAATLVGRRKRKGVTPSFSSIPPGP
jgi:hypothetical protein